jgi:hypothetical protein
MRSKAFYLAVLIIFVSTLSHSQDKTEFTNPVHPFVAGGVILNGSGYTPVGATIDAGVIVDAPHLFSYSEAGYETGGKSSYNANISSGGHTRLLANETLARFGDWYAGMGVDWVKLYTPAYSKSNVHPKATMGHEFYSGYVNKVLISYVAPGTDWANGVQGFEAQGWWTGKHIFLRMTVGGYWYHMTVTDRTNVAMTADQRSNKSMTSQFQTVLGWRF